MVSKCLMVVSVNFATCCLGYAGSEENTLLKLTINTPVKSVQNVALIQARKNLKNEFMSVMNVGIKRQEIMLVVE